MPSFLIDPERLNAAAPSSAPLFFTRTYRMRGLVQPPSLTRIAGANKEISKAALSLRSRTIHPRLAPLLGGAPSKIIRAFGGVAGGGRQRSSFITWGELSSLPPAYSAIHLSLSVEPRLQSGAERGRGR
ncbi:hypothetical protein NPIL_691881 [Nephila pilipes]|uniref:Uncharacterized protein n=1 Tax=Nephila pilipes TaxID=299642 RepID=A0A8X6P0A4_NEPPI|nr:hypothetical protein NPIL_691881 [Nephila pilipes]